MRVAEVMTPRSELVTATVPGSREDVLQLLQRREFSSVPVVKETDQGEIYRGLVTRERLIENPDEDQLAMLLEEVAAIESGASLEELAEEMVTTGARRIPIVDGELEGIVTVTDVIRAIANGKAEIDATVEAYAEREVHTTYTEATLHAAERGLFYADEAYAVVLDRDGEMAGMLTEVDIIDVATVIQGQERTGDSIADQDSDWAWEGIKAIGSRYLTTLNVEFPDDPVSSVMTEDVVTISRQRSVSEAAQRMITNDIEQIPMVRGDEIVGMVKDLQLLESLYA